MGNELVVSSAREFLELYSSENQTCIDSSQINSIFERLIKADNQQGSPLLKDFAREVYRQYTEKYSGIRRFSLLWSAGRKDHPYSIIPEMVSRRVCDGKKLNRKLDALEVYEDFDK